MTDISRRVAIGSLAAGAAGLTASSAAPSAAQTLASLGLRLSAALPHACTME